MIVNVVALDRRTPGRKALAGSLLGAIALLATGFVAAFGGATTTDRSFGEPPPRLAGRRGRDA